MGISKLFFEDFTNELALDNNFKITAAKEYTLPIIRHQVEVSILARRKLSIIEAMIVDVLHAIAPGKIEVAELADILGITEDKLQHELNTLTDNGITLFNNEVVGIFDEAMICVKDHYSLETALIKEFTCYYEPNTKFLVENINQFSTEDNLSMHKISKEDLNNQLACELLDKAKIPTVYQQLTGKPLDDKLIDMTIENISTRSNDSGRRILITELQLLTKEFDERNKSLWNSNNKKLIPIA